METRPHLHFMLIIYAHNCKGHTGLICFLHKTAALWYILGSLSYSPVYTYEHLKSFSCGLRKPKKLSQAVWEC